MIIFVILIKMKKQIQVTTMIQMEYENFDLFTVSVVYYLLNRD